ncbi:MAG: hypothetical protein JKY94_11030 [Rhodobacteraceae bacterium]|nr:hypothetical protein [Paracoccaceae bacterium]
MPETKVSNTETYTYGALAGRFVRAEIWRDLNELENMNSRNWYQKVLTQWKLNKTARSPVVHMNNVMSNMLLMDMADVRMPDLISGIASYMRGDEHYQEALENGAFGSDMIAQEMKRNVLEPILKELHADIKSDAQNITRASDPRAIRVLSAIARASWSPVKGAIKGGLWADKKMTNLYQLEDEVFRMATYVRRRSQGATAREAAIEARDQFLNYDIHAPWINAARRSVLPFLSYTYRAIPKVAESITHRPWKLAKYAIIAQAVNALAYELAPSGDDEDKERRSMRSQEQGRTWIGTPRMMRMPWLDQYLNPVFMDIRRWIPAGDVFDTNQGSSAVPIPSWLQFGGPLMIGAEVALNKQAFTGKEITNNLTDTNAEKAWEVGKHLYKSWIPSAAYIPFSWYWDKTDRALSGAREWGTGRPYSVKQALVSSIGIKVKPQDVGMGFKWRAIEFNRVERELNFQAKRLGNDRLRGIISKSEYEAAMATIKRKNDHLRAEKAKVFKRH